MENESFRELNFVSLETAVLCADCEIITDSHGGRCRVCDGSALLSLSRVLGGPLGTERAVLLDPAVLEMNQMIDQLIESAYSKDPDEETAA